MAAIIFASNIRGTHNLPDKVDDQYWRGRCGHATLSKAALAQKVQSLYNVAAPSWLSKAQLVAALDAKNRPVTTGDTCDNDICPLTQDELVEPIFIRTTSNGYRRGFALDRIADYFLTTGTVVDPVDRETLIHDDLERMDAQLKKHGIVRKSIVRIVSDEEQAKYRLKKDREEVMGLLLDAIRDTFLPVAHDVLALARVGHNTRGTRAQYRSVYTLREYCHACARHDLQPLVDLSSELCDQVQQSTQWSNTEKAILITFVEEVMVEAITENAYLSEQPFGAFHDDNAFSDDSVIELVMVSMQDG